MKEDFVVGRHFSRPPSRRKSAVGSIVPIYINTLPYVYLCRLHVMYTHNYGLRLGCDALVYTQSPCLHLTASGHWLCNERLNGRRRRRRVLRITILYTLQTISQALRNTGSVHLSRTATGHDTKMREKKKKNLGNYNFCTKVFFFNRSVINSSR